MKTKTLKDACKLYLDHLKAIGKKPSTLGTTRRTLDLLVADMGEDKEVGKILPLHVDKFFKSEAATMLKGKPRAEASILQIRRIVRSALVFWHEQGLSKYVALPKDEKKYIEPKVKPVPRKTEGKTTAAKADKPKKNRKVKSKKDKPAPTDEKAWTGFEDDDETKVQKGETVASFHFDKAGE